MGSETCIVESGLLPRGSFLRRLLGSLGNQYCRVFHESISRPVDGTYRCWTCLREFETGWRKDLGVGQAKPSGEVCGRQAKDLPQVGSVSAAGW